MRLCISLRLRAALIAATSLLLSYTIPDAQASGIATTKTELTGTTLTELHAGDSALYPKASAYQLEEVTGSVTEDLFSIVKYIFDEDTEEIREVRYNVTFSNTLGEYGAGDTYNAKYNFTLQTNTDQLITSWTTETVPDITAKYTLEIRKVLESTEEGYTGSIFGVNSEIPSGTVYGGALHVSGNQTGGDIKGDYINNRSISSGGYGAAMYFSGSTMGSLIGNVISNRSDVTANTYGGATHITGSSFTNITGDYIANTVFATRSTSNTRFTIRGGAIFLQNSTVGNLTGDFIRNAIVSSNNATNTSAKNGYGGALYIERTSNNSATITNIKGDYTGNYISLNSNADTWVSGHGGAIAINAGAVVDNITGDFTGNYAETFGDNNTAHTTGGAVGVFSATLNTIVGNFTANYTKAVSRSGSTVQGGALRVSGSNGADFEVNSITGDFHSNYVSATADNLASSSYGGAIENNGTTIKNITGSFYNNYAAADYIDNGTTSRAQGGAIYNSNASLGLLVEDSIIVFKGNYVMSHVTGEKVYNAIYNTADSNIYFNAYDTSAVGVGQIHVYDTIDGDVATQATQRLHINSGNDGAGASMGISAAYLSDVLFYNEVSNQNITVYNGTLQLSDFTGSGDIPAAHAMLINSSLTVNSGANVDAGSADYLGEGNTITNNGTITLGTGALSSAISGSGVIIIDSESTVVASATSFTGTGTGRIDGTLELTDGAIAHSWTGDGKLVVDTGSSVSSSVEYLQMGSTQIDGSLTLTYGGDLTTKLSGEGTLNVSAGINTDASNLNTKAVIMGARINLTGGTLELYGDSSETSFQVNHFLVIQGDVTINTKLTGSGQMSILAADKLTINADNIAMDEGARLYNSGTLSLTGGTLVRRFTSSGSLYVGREYSVSSDIYNIGMTGAHDIDGTLELTGTGSLGSSYTGDGTLSIATGGTITSTLDKVGVAIVDVDGSLELTGSGELTSSYTGDGTLRITTDSSMTSTVGKMGVAIADVGGTLELTGTGDSTTSYTGDGTLRITTGSSMTSSVEKVSVANVDVDGTFELTGTGSLNSSYTGDGTLRIATDGNITTSADKLVIDDINVNGTLTLNGGTLNAALMSGPSFTGDGKLVIAAEQTVTMEKSTFTSRPQINVATTEVNGTLALSATDVFTNDDFTINGTLSIVGSSTIDGSMQGEGSINISASTQLSMDANAIASSEDLTINNSGTLRLRGTGAIDRTIGGSGLIKLLSGDDLTTRADFYGTTNRIDSNYGILRLTTGTLTHLISGSTDIYIHSGNTVTTSIDTFNYNTKNDFFIEGTLALTGTGTLSKILDDDVYFATLGAGTVQITEGSDITADLYYLKSNIELDGDLTITNIEGENKLMAAVTGTGTLTVNEGTTEFYTTADNLRMDTLYNDGTITLSGELTGTTTAGTLDTTLLGNGEVIIKSKTTMNADVLDTTNTITNNSTIVLTGGTLNKSVEGGGALEILSGASVSMGRQYLEDYYTITTDGTLLITGGGTIAKDISGEGYVTINAPTTLSSTITSGFGAIIDETNSGRLHVTSSGSILGIGSYALNLTGDISLADRFITWDDEAGMLDRESLQASFHLTYNGQYSPFVNITQDGNSYSLSVYEVGAYDPLSGYYLEDKADGVSGNAFVLSDYKYGSAADAESYVKFRGTVGDDYSQEADPSLKSRAASYVWKTDAEGNVYLDELSTHSAGADVYAYSRNNEEVAFWKLDPPDWDENPNPEFNRSFIGFKDGDLQAFYFVSEWRTVKQIDGDFIDNSHSKYSLYSPAYGGAMHLARNVTVTKVNSNFVGNRAHHTDSTTTGGFDTRGGAIYAHSSDIGDIVGNFIGNAAYSYSQHETGTLLTTNHQAEGGAIFLDEDASIVSITGDFVGNYAVSRNDNYRYEYYKASGGALRLQVGATIDSIEGNFTQNYSSAGHFVTGGAISLISKANIKNIKGNFYGNYATTQVPGSESILPGGKFKVKWAKGGAISMEDGHISNIEGDFEMNKAISSQDSQGGAIHMEDLKGEQRDITILGDFKGNASIADEDAYGGAMFYHDYLIRSISYDATVDDYMDLQYVAGLVEITGDFIGNYASGKDNAYGGAIYNHGGEISILAEEKDSSVLFEGNYTTLDGGVTKEYNAIHNTARNNEYVDAAPAVVNFEATGDNVIVVNDSIDGYSTELASDLHLRNWQVLNINLKANVAGATGDYSRVEFNNHVSDQTVNVYGGELRLGNDGRTRSTTPSSMLQRVNLTVFNTAKVEANFADSLGNGDNNILVTEEGYLNMHAGTLRNDVTANMEGIIHIQEGVTIDSILTIEDGATVRGTAGVDSRLEYVTLGVNSEVNGQAIAMEHGTIELTTTGAIAKTTVEDYTVNYITVAAKADIYEISGSLTLNINTINEEITLEEFIKGLYGKGVLLNDYEGISTDVIASDLDITESVYININGTNIAVNSVHNLNGGLLFVLLPEPSTATLSLLALTALLARRRRTRV